MNKAALTQAQPLEDDVSDYDGSALALAGASRRGHVGSLCASTPCDAGQAVATDRRSSVFLPGLLRQEHEAPLGLIVVV
jgi:hypothetical protein